MPLLSYLVVLVGLYLAILVLICLGQGILGGISVLMVCPPERWNLAIINALRLFVGFWGTLKGQLRRFWMALLKLRYCTTIFTTRFHPWSLPRVGNGSGKRQFVTPGTHSDPRGNLGKRVRLTRKTRPGVSSHSFPDPGHPTPRRWKKLRLPSSEEVEGEVGEPRNLFPRLGVG